MNSIEQEIANSIQAMETGESRYIDGRRIVTQSEIDLADMEAQQALEAQQVNPEMMAEGQAITPQLEGEPQPIPGTKQGEQAFGGVEDQTNIEAIAGPVDSMGVGEFLETTGRVFSGAAGGAATATLGLPGDVIGIIEGIVKASGAPEGEGLDAFLQGMGRVSEQYGSAATTKMLYDFVDRLDITDEAKEQIKAGSALLGEWGEIPGVAVAAKAFMNGVEGLTSYAAGAQGRIADRGMTLQSGIDPAAALDEIIVGFGRAREVRPPTETEPGIIVFHGSGSDFDRFELSKIGTGEGAQAFGRGLYFTDLEDVAKFYRDSVGLGKEVTYKGRKLKDTDSDAVSREDHLAVMVGQQDTKEAMQILAAKEVQRARDNLAGISQAIEDHAKNPDVYPLRFWGMDIDEAKSLEVKKFWEDELEAALEVEKNVDSISAKPAGKMYQAKLKVDPKKLLDYDKPMSAQNSFVRGKIEELVQEINLDDAVNLGFDPFEMGEEAALQAARESMLDSEVLTFLNTWRDIRGVEGAAEELLDKYGIKGIKYKAMQGVGARNVPETGAQNYVIFDENLIEIMKKYGIVGSVAVSSVAATQGKPDQGEAQ